jgi:hypothetical protein
MPIDKVTRAINELILAANAWDSAWRATHGKSFTAGDTAMEALVAQRDKAEEELSAAVYWLNTVYNEVSSTE